MLPSQSKEFFINMKPGDIPQWVDGSTYAEQPASVREFWAEEMKKVMNGIRIDGIFIHPWLYYHCNFWPMFIDRDDFGRYEGISVLRDNEYYFSEMLQKAEAERKGILMFGTRRFGKALMNTEKIYTAAGPKCIGDALVGDRIFGPDGKLTMIKNVYPQGKVKIFRITFEDGRESFCCKDHLWKVYNKKNFDVVTLERLSFMDYKKMSIELASPLSYPDNDNISYGVIDCIAGNCGNYLTGSNSDIPISRIPVDELLICSPFQKESFIKQFIRSACGSQPSGYDEIDIARNDANLIKFICRMFWSSGWYCKYENKKLTVSNTEQYTGITDIRYHGMYDATCIEVVSDSRLFVASDYLVTHNSSIMSSFIAYRSTITSGQTHTVTGFNDGDLQEVAKYLEYGLDNIHPFFYSSRPNNQWDKEVIIGTTDRATNKKHIQARISIKNVAMGSRKSSQKTAGPTPITAIWDEVGKGAIIKPYLAAMPSYQSAFGQRCLPILAGTPGEETLSEDIRTILSNPELYNLLLMDWNLLSSKTKHPLFAERKFGMFLPGQMAMIPDSIKVETNLAAYLNSKDKALQKIKIRVTDFEASTQKMQETLAGLKTKDHALYISTRSSFPLNTDDCFISQEQNQFPVEVIVKLINDIMEEGRPGFIADTIMEPDMKVGFTSSIKPIAPFPFTAGGSFDAGIQIFERPESSNYDDRIYTAGIDVYKQDTVKKAKKSSTSLSLGSMHIYKRLTRINDPFANSIVASYVARPASMNEFCRKCEMLQDAYGAVCLQENADLMYQHYLEKKRRSTALLFAGEQIVNSMTKAGTVQSNKLGIYPSPSNKAFWIRTAIQYANEETIAGYDEQGEPIVKLGVARIRDLELLKEMMNYGKYDNYDRLTSFSLALVLAQYYDHKNWGAKKTPQPETYNPSRQQRTPWMDMVITSRKLGIYK